MIWCITPGGNYASGSRANAYILSKFLHIETSQKSNIKAHQTNCHPISLYVSQLCILRGNDSKDIPFRAFILYFVLELHCNAVSTDFMLNLLQKFFPPRKVLFNLPKMSFTVLGSLAQIPGSVAHQIKPNHLGIPQLEGLRDLLKYRRENM